MAKSGYEVVLSPEAVRELRRLRVYIRADVENAIDRHLSLRPASTSRSRIKRLRGVRRPQYRLRVGGVRVFYDVRGRAVEILAIISKDQAAVWLQA